MDYEKCECNDNWIGLSCESPTCYKVNNCSLNGLCVSPNKCECFEQYDGENCTEKVAANSNTPIFSNGSYFAVVSENRGKDYVVLTVSANDLDHGRSGEISYSIEEANIANFFMIAHESGQIAVAADGVLDYETIIQKQFTFIVAATDNGIPSQRSEANVTIIVKDENDNCPVFKTLPGNYKIPLEIVANDNDYGDNGRIHYSIAEETDPDRKFSISSNGILSANSVLQPGAYSLTIVAQDGGVIPCVRELSLTVVVDEIVFVSTSTAIALEISSSLQSSTIALKPSSSVQSSTIALKPSSTLQSSTIALKVSSSLHSSTVALKLSSSLQSSTIALKPSSSLQSSTIALKPSSSLQSSTIALKPTSVQSSTVVPEQSSSLQSSTIALKPTSVQSSTVVPEQSSSLQSSTIALKPTSVQSSTVVPEQSSSLQSSTIALKTSSSLQLSTLGQESLSSLDSSTHTYKPSTSLQASIIAFEPSSSVHQSDPIDMVSTNTEQLQPTKTGSAERPTSSTTSNNIVFVKIRLLNIGFVVGYRNKNSIDYKNLRRMVEMTVKDIFEKIEGFLGIFDIDFEQGSVIANIQTEVSSENTQVNTSSLAKAVFDAGDENGRLGELHLDTAFLREQITPTTPPTTETSNEEDDNDAFIAAGISIGLAALICFALALCLVSINF